MSRGLGLGRLRLQRRKAGGFTLLPGGTPAPTVPIALTSATSFVDDGETWTFYATKDTAPGPVQRQIYTFQEGQRGFVSAGQDTWLKSDKPSVAVNGFVANGTMENWYSATEQGVDEMLGAQTGATRIAYNPALNVKDADGWLFIPAGKNASYVTGHRRAGTTAPISTAQRYFTDYAVFHALAAIPNAGSFAPATCAIDKTIRFNINDARLDAIRNGLTLQNVAGTGGTFPTLATLQSRNLLKKWMPYAVGLQQYEQVRSLLTDETPGVEALDSGYGGNAGGWGDWLADYMWVGVLAPGKTAYDPTILHRLISLGIQIEAQAARGNLLAYGAGQRHGYKPATMLLAALFGHKEAGLTDRCRSVLANCSHKYDYIKQSKIGQAPPWPGNHDQLCKTPEQVELGRPAQDNDDPDARTGSDYEHTASYPGFAEHLACCYLDHVDRDGSQVAAGSLVGFSSRGAGALSYYDQLLFRNPDNYMLPPYSQRHAALYNQIRPLMAQPLIYYQPCEASPRFDRSSVYITTQANGVTFDFTGIGCCPGTPLQARVYVTLDGIQLIECTNYEAGSNGYKGSFTLTPGVQHYFTIEQRNAAGWGPKSPIWPKSVRTAEGGTRFAGSMAAGSPTLTVSAVSGGTLAVGQMVLAPGLPYGTYVKALGTSTGGAGTVTLSNAPAVAMTYTTGDGWAGFSALRATPTGTPSGAAVNTVAPKLYVRTYHGNPNYLFEEAAATLDFNKGKTIFAGAGYWTGTLAGFTYAHLRDAVAVSAAVQQESSLVSTDLATIRSANVTTNGVTATTAGRTIPTRPAQPADVIFRLDRDAELFYPNVMASLRATSSGVSAVRIGFYTKSTVDGEGDTISERKTALIGQKNAAQPTISGDLAADGNAMSFPLVAGQLVRVRGVAVMGYNESGAVAGLQTSRTGTLAAGTANTLQTYPLTPTSYVTAAATPPPIEVAFDSGPVTAAAATMFIRHFWNTNTGGTTGGNPMFSQLEVLRA